MMSFNLPKRQSMGKPPNTQSDQKPTSGLLKALMETGRTKGSSATPAPPPVLSPNPNRGFQAQLDKLNNAGHSEENRGQDMLKADARYGAFSQGLGGAHNRTMSSVTQQSFQTGGYATRNPTPAAGPNQLRSSEGQGSRQGDDQPMSVARLGQEIFDGLKDLGSKIQSCKGMNPNVQNYLFNEIRRVDQELANSRVSLQHEFDRAASDRNSLYQQIDQIQQQLEASQQDRDHYCMERDQLQRTVDAIRVKERKNAEKFNKLEQEYKKQIDDLHKQVTVMDEQLKGKRALWLDSNPGSSARREAMNATMRDPFNSPSTSQHTGFDSGFMGGHGSVLSSLRGPSESSFGQPTSSLAPVGAPRGPRRRGNLPTGSALPAKVIPASIWTEPSTFRPFKTEPSTPPLPAATSMALVPFNNESDPAPVYKAEFTKVYGLVEGWVKTYASTPNLASDQQVARSNDVLWAFMMNCTYPGQRQDAHTHVMTLLNDPNTRCWFVMRMAIAYLTKEVMTIGAFKAFNPGSDGEFAEVKTKLSDLRGLANESRQNLIDQQARAIQSIVASPNYQDFRLTEISIHSKKLRDMLGPFLNPGCVRAEAGRDLGAIVIKAWELSIKMFTSHLTFQVYFPETASKFMAATMIAKDQPRVDPIRLQIKQTRLKLVITPVITLRDDRGTTIKAKNLHLSTVLTMG